MLTLPSDVRLAIYDEVLADAQTVRRSSQPYNAHYRLLHACRLVYYEARNVFHGYLSLRNESQIRRFLSSPDIAPSVRWADVANDGRIGPATLARDPPLPASHLHLVLAALTRLETLRVFDVRHHHPFNVRYRLDFERAMYPLKHGPSVTSYQLYLDPSTRVAAFDRIPSHAVRTLRLSGDCHIPLDTDFSELRHLTIRSVTSSTFDRIRFNTVFASSQLSSFTHVQGHRLGFEIRNVHLESLVDGPGRRLRKLVLLGCARLSTSVIASCLHNLPMLEYFALSLVTVNELRENFILALGPSLQTLKLQVIHAWYAVPLFEQERIICNSLEERFLSPKSPLDTLHVSFHDRIMSEGGREDRWKRIARARHLALKIGPWEDDEDT